MALAIARRLLRNIIPTQGLNLFVRHADHKSDASPSQPIHGEKKMKEGSAPENFRTLSKQTALELEAKYTMELASLHPTMNFTEGSQPIVISLDSWCRWLSSVSCEKRRGLCNLMKKCNIQVVRDVDAPVKKLTRLPLIAKWEGSPDEEELTCSVDGIFIPGSPVGNGYCGGLYRNHLSFMEGDIWACAIEDVKNIFDVEFTAIIRALEYFITHRHYTRYKKLLVQCDNSEAVHFANGTRLATIEDRVILVSKFTALKSELERQGIQVRVEHVKRFTNKAADSIVNLFYSLKKASIIEKGGKIETVDLTKDNLSKVARKVKAAILKKCNFHTILKEDAAGKYRIEF